MDERLQSFPKHPRYVPFRPPPPSTGTGGGPEFFHSPHHGPPTHLPPPPHHHQLPPPPPDYGLPLRYPAPPLSPSPIARIHHEHLFSPNATFHHHHQQRQVNSPSRHHNRNRLDHPPPPPPPIDEPAHLRRHGNEIHQHYLQQNRTYRSEEFPHPPPRVSGRPDVFDHDERHGNHRSPRLPRFDYRSVRSDYGSTTLRDRIDAPFRQPMSRMELDREAHHRSHNRDRIPPPVGRMGAGHRNQQGLEFVRDEETRLDRRFRENDVAMRTRRDNGDRFSFREDDGREGSHQSRMGLEHLREREFLMRPGCAETERWDQNSRNGIRSLIEVVNRGTDSRNGYSELSELGKARELDSGRYGYRDRREDAHSHNHSPNKRLERKSPFLRIQLERPSDRSRNDFCSTKRDRETVEYQDLSPRGVRESSPIVCFKSNLLIVGPSSSKKVPDTKPSPGDWKNTNNSLPESSDQVLSVDSADKQCQLKSEIKFCCENELSPMLVEEEPKAPFSTKEAVVSVPLEKTISHGTNPEPVAREGENSFGNGNHQQSPKWRDLDKDSTYSGSEQESSHNISYRRELVNPASLSSVGKKSQADQKVHISSDSIDNATVVNCVRHFGDCKKVNKLLAKSSDQVLPVDSVVKQCELTSEVKSGSENELSAMDEEEKPKVSSNVKEVVSVEKSTFNGVDPKPDPSKTNLLSGNEDQPHSPKCTVSDKDSACSDSGKESSLYIGKKRKLTLLSSSDLGKNNPTGKRVNESSLSVNDVIDCVGEDQQPTLEKIGKSCLNKAVVESPSPLQDKKVADDSASGASAVSPISSVKTKDCSFGNGGSTTMNFDECGGTLDCNDRERNVRPALDSRTISERVANEKSFISEACTAAGTEGDLPGKVLNKISFSDIVLDCNVSEEPCESDTPLFPKGCASGDFRNAKVPLLELSNTLKCSGVEDYHHSENEANFVVGGSKNGSDIMAGNTITYSQSSDDVKHANNEELIQNQSCQGKFTESLSYGASGVPPEASDAAGGELASLIRNDYVSNVRSRILTTDSGVNRVKDNDGDFLTLGSSATLDLIQDQTITGLKHNGEELESHVGKYEPVNENELIDRPQEVVIPLSHCDQSGQDFLSSIKKRKFLSPVTEVLQSVPAEICDTTSSMEATPCDAQVPSDVVNASLQLAGKVEASSAEPISRYSTTNFPSKDIDLSNSFAGGGSTVTDLVGGYCNDVCSAAHKLTFPDNIVLPSTVEFPSLFRIENVSSLTASDDACDMVVESGNTKEACNDNRTVECGDESVWPGGERLTNCVDIKVLNADTSSDIKFPAEEGLPTGSCCQPVLVHSTFDDCAANNSPQNCISEIVSLPQRCLEMSVALENKICEKKLLCSDNLSEERSLAVLPSISTNNVASSAVGLKANGPTERQQELSGKTASLPPLSHITKRTMQKSAEVSINPQSGRNDEPGGASGKVTSGPSFIAPFIRKPALRVTKPRTWRRTDALPPAQLTEKKSNVISPPLQKPSYILGMKARNNSYIRKGNSLVRNPALASSEGSSPAPTSSAKLIFSSYPSTVASTEMSKAPSPPCNSMLSNSGFIPLGDGRSSPSSDSFVATEADRQGSPESLSKCLRTSDSDKRFEDQSVLSDANQATSGVNKVVYIKHKSNQLVAAPKHSEVPIQSVDLSSKVYYKRKRNQLVRASSQSHTQLNSVCDDGSNSNEQRVLKPYSCRSTSKRQANKVRKTSGSQKLSLVWTLCGAQSPKKVTNSLRCKNVLPHLLPWKRVAYFSKNPSSFFSHKLLSSKRRNIIYTRSGFSLRRSKVVSVAGCSLKWSKSLEKRSKKADKEAALAIHAMKKGKNGMDPGATVGKSRNNVSRERIYRIGNSRYKMDPSRRTLQRISDEASSSLVDGLNKKAAKSCAVPKRLLIGHDEYVRIGNGNQLVRNAKRRTRIIASERVRWSLHTVRMRLAKKRKYCQFFTRFGKCNKVEGKCSYIHDESKVAVCTKFLNDSCSDPDCKLTHKVIPERMPDCSFFLQGLCSNENCPYRHVNVNPKAAICENFLKGYCDEGDECRKKHSYTCPTFEVTGECPEGSKCKLYHPKKGKYNGKRGVLKQYQKSSWVRYFDSGKTALAESSEKEGNTATQCLPKDSDQNMLVEDGSLADFISLEGYSDIEDEEPDYLANKQLADLSNRGDSSRLQLGDSDDERIKPIRLLLG